MYKPILHTLTRCPLDFLASIGMSHSPVFFLFCFVLFCFVFSVNSVDFSLFFFCCKKRLVYKT